MSIQPTDLEPIWAQYPDSSQPASCEFLGNCGGFSGARLWQAQSPVGMLCLRAWPRDSLSEAQLTFMHSVLLRVNAHRVDFVPAPLRTRSGATFLRHDGVFWELTPWMPGYADYHQRPRPERLRAAMQALAQFHLAAASTNSVDPVAPSSTLQRRVRELRAFLTGPASEELRRRVPDGRWPEMDERALRILDYVAAHKKELMGLLDCPLSRVTQQPVIRDIWHDHVLYTGNSVTGIIDFGAMSVDTVAVDIARLLGSLADGDALQWREGLRAYRELRPVSLAQQELLVTLDRTGVFAGGLVWLRWHYLENRVFENHAGVLSRVDHFLNRLATFEEAGPTAAKISSSVA
jgi:Ser/Thr protein kinase RdoA (MazF antagonist)